MRFRWRREWPFALALMVVALAHRIPTARYAEMFLNGDGGLDNLMAVHHWQAWHGEAPAPIYFYGQAYNGTLESFFAAPFYALFGHYPQFGTNPDGASVLGMGIAQALLSAILLACLYPLCFAVGGRAGAVLGCLPAALGTMALTDDLCGHQHSYHALRILSVVIALVGIPYVTRPSLPRVAVLGVLVGLAMYNNPQIISVVVPLGFLLYLRGDTSARLAGGLVPFVRTLGGWGPWLTAWLVGLGLAAGTSAALSFYDGGVAIPLGSFTVSLSRPYEYLKLICGLIGATVLGLEWTLSRHRRAWVRHAVVFGAAYLVGNAPNLYYHLTAPPIRSAPTGIGLAHLASHASDLVRWGGYTLFNSSNTPWIAKTGAYAALLGFTLAFVAVASVGALWCLRIPLARMLLVRPVPPTVGVVVVLQAAITLALWMLFPRPDMYARYLLVMWIPYSVLLAGSYAALRRVLSSVFAALPLVVVIAYYVLATAHNFLYAADLHPDREQIFEFREVNRVALAALHDPHLAGPEVPRDPIPPDFRGAGYANYFYGYRMTFLSRERMAYRPWPRDDGLDGQPELFAGYVERARTARRLVYVFNLSESFGVDHDTIHFHHMNHLVEAGRLEVLAQRVVPVLFRDAYQAGGTPTSFGDFWIYVVERRRPGAMAPAPVPDHDDVALVAWLEARGLADGYARTRPIGEAVARASRGRIALRDLPFEQRERRAFRRDHWPDEHLAPPRGRGHDPPAGDLAYVFDASDPWVDGPMERRVRSDAARGELAIADEARVGRYVVLRVRWTR